MSSFKFPSSTVNPGPPARTPPSCKATPTSAGFIQIIRFLISGGSATLAHWAVMALLLWGGAHALPSTIVGAFVSSVWNYRVLFHWTFSGNGAHAQAVPAYAGTVAFGWCANAGLFYFLTSFSQLDNGPAQVCSSAAVAAINFILYKRLVFNERTN